MPHPYFFLASLAWNLALGMTWLAVPLYAYSQGLSNAQSGTASQVMPRARFQAREARKKYGCGTPDYGLRP